MKADARVAWELYKRILLVSPTDMHGMPTLQNIEHVFTAYNFEVDDIEEVNEMIIRIYETHLRYLKEKAQSGA